MGYTHYWRLARPITPDELAALAEDVRAIVGSSGVQVAGWNGSGSPEYGPDRIALNGGCETFALDMTRIDFDFCKTRQLPYDVVVTASLLALKDHLTADVRISSDGEPADWEVGYLLALKALQRFIPSPAQVLGGELP